MSTVLAGEAVLTGRGRVGNAIMIRDGVVAGVGAAEELASHPDRMIRYPGGFIVPGFRDAHIHAIPYAGLLTGCSLHAASSIDDLLNRLAAFANTLPPTAPVVASRLNDESLAEVRLPTREDLDRAVPNRPAVIYRYCGHIAVANSTALQASGITEMTPDPPGGVIDRGTDGQPTGVLRETATGLIADALARGTSLASPGLLDGLARLGGLGITSIGAMIGYGERPHHKLAAEAELLRGIAGNLPLKVHAISIAGSAEDLDLSARVLSGGAPRLRWLGVKCFADGSLGGHTAAMETEYDDTPSVGTYRLTDLDIDLARHSLAQGGMVAIHAIGDRAIGGVLDAFEELIANGAKPSDLRMEHVSIASPHLVSRFARTGTIAVVQPSFLASEHGWLGKRLGTSRLEWAYPFRSMARAGIILAGSSDSIVEPPHPLWGIAAAMDRHGIAPDEAISGLEALAMFTDGGAVALREPVPLAVGSPADIAVIDIDLRTATAPEIRKATVLDTWIDGERLEVDRSLPVWVE
ncbi:MAG: amidohydrolase [Acidimicrobiia bacterium]